MSGSDKNIPLVTICIPNFNKAKFITETIESVFNQTYSNIEIILIDDCSTDGSKEIIKKLSSASPYPYYVYENEMNKGVSFSSNRGAGLASGKYFQILSSDDVILPDKIKVQVSVLEKDNDLAGIYGNIIIIDEQSQPANTNYFAEIGWTNPLPSGNIFSSLLQMNFVPAPTTLFRTQYIIETGNYDAGLKLEDWDMLLSLSEKYAVQYIDEIFALYRIEQNSLMRSSKNKPVMFDAMCRTLFKRLGKSKTTDTIINRNLSNYAGQIYASGGAAPKYWLKKSLRQNWNTKNVLYLIAAQLGIPYNFYRKLRKL